MMLVPSTAIHAEPREEVPVPKLVDHDERREAIAAALWRVVIRNGAGAITVRAVAEEAGMSATNVVHYLPSRAEMLGLAVRSLVRSSWLHFEQARQSDVTLASAVDLMMVTIPDSPARRRQSEVWLLLLAEQSTNTEAQAILSELTSEVAAGARAFVGLLGDHGLVHPRRNVAVEAERIHALADGLAVQTLVDPTTMTPEKLRTIVEAHLRELAKPPPA
jgi:AcrR family transcriptional regulator